MSDGMTNGSQFAISHEPTTHHPHLHRSNMTSQVLSTVNVGPENGLYGYQSYLHDRSLRPIEEAILQHAATRKAPPPAAYKAIIELPRARVLPCHREMFNHDDRNCMVCFDRLLDENMLVRLPCGHILHQKCAVQWLMKNCTCPECRFELETDEETYEQGRLKRMKDRKVVKCNCASHIHSCFFSYPSQTLPQQR